MGISDRDAEKMGEAVRGGNLTGLPGVLRASFGLYNDKTDVDALCDCLEAIARGEHGKYDADPKNGECRPQGRPKLRPADYFNLTPRLPG
jgi:hypothetical protein